MPIRPENRDRYPADWPEISRAIKERGGWRCECCGECGRGTHPGRCPNRHQQPAYGTGSAVVLTTAHLNHIPEDCRPANLRSMCQGCHLHYDRDHHRQTAAATRRRAIEQAGQLTLDTDLESPLSTDTTLRDQIAAAIRADLKKAVPPLEIAPGHRIGGMGRTEYDLADAAFTAMQTALLPAWQAVYEPGNVSDYLIGYTNDEIPAKRAAEAWFRTQRADEPGPLDWIADPAQAVGEYDVWHELVEVDDEFKVITKPGVSVRRRALSATSEAS